jgi:hypothetical protein
MDQDRSAAVVLAPVVKTENLSYVDMDGLHRQTFYGPTVVAWQGHLDGGSVGEFITKYIRNMRNAW